MMDRRIFTLGAILAVGCQTGPDGWANQADLSRVERAFLIGYPIWRMAMTRDAAARRALGEGHAPFNRFNHRADLSDHTHRAVTTPNNDTLYSGAWLDLSAGPVRLTIPENVDRYFSVALLDVHTDTVAVLGQDAAGEWLIAGPEGRGAPPAQARVLECPSRDAWLILRVLVDDAQDLAAARLVQAGFTLAPSATPRVFLPALDLSQTEPERFLDVVNLMLARSPTPAWMGSIADLASVGVRPGVAGAFASLQRETRTAWMRSFPAFHAALRNGLEAAGDVHNGWSYPKPGMGAFGDDYLYRARVAAGGLGALPETEALYVSTSRDASGQMLDGANAYVLDLPAALPKAAFWSLSLYEISADGRLFFTPNAINRFSIGDRTKGLNTSPAGLRIAISHTTPMAPGTNWLPAPHGPFHLTFRVYRPAPAWGDGVFRLPGVALT